ncbi:zinc ribbon domain-containing protein [Sulfuracidifex metallicus]|uniref:Zinc-ribbon domain-containing protein n=1 Tax=Sulfuracidifex metallicus DSM 6482 = JCM 9184 TaxID=523847 RepID=A0A6A9QNQ1_SULME|nr:zinc ribbon domain-containing protein [Sulfuracidifex metallicus]MUN29769.1 zinc-ribbon domain-containing protein [Sulfuracidifex metallicus DSM 6482 = JCM 9184]WOE51850.1 zinc ribbon domain-containing protein [Sulfuracidifex metallicus DSM 6482 = JCM 9184]
MNPNSPLAAATYNYSDDRILSEMIIAPHVLYTEKDINMNMDKCPMCGNRLTPGLNYCEACGADVSVYDQVYHDVVYAYSATPIQPQYPQQQPYPPATPPQSTPQTPMTNCPHCGASIPQGTRFCPYCGKEIKKHHFW